MMDVTNQSMKLKKMEDVSSGQPLVSVVIIFLNPGVFLIEAIESVLAQTYTCWELLLVDDGSTDSSTAAARSFADQFPEKIRCLEHAGHQNRGKPASRNLGIQHASGEYIAFLDADDIWLPEKLEQQVSILEANPDVAMVYGRSQYWFSWTGRPEDLQRDYVFELGVQPDIAIQPPSLLSPFFLLQEYAIPVPSDVLVRKKAVDEIGGFDESFYGVNNIYEDQAFFAKVALKSPLMATDACWDLYRQHPSMSCQEAERAGQTYQARLFFLNWLAGYLNEQGVTEPEIRRSLQAEIKRCRHPVIDQARMGGRQIARRLKHLPFQLAYRFLPSPIFDWLRARWRGEPYIPPPGWVRMGDLRRTSPFSRVFGFDRGKPVDRYYIENFLARHQADIQGRVLEISDDSYTRQFGGSRVAKSEVLSVSEGDPKATIIGDLIDIPQIPDGTFDCVILTQTLQLIYDVPAVLRTIQRILKPGGIALVTVPGISHISRYDMDRWGYYWGFTSLSARRLFEAVFPTDHIWVEVYGNVLSATAFLYGMAAEELRPGELDTQDPDYEVTIAIRSQKPLLVE